MSVTQNVNLIATAIGVTVGIITAAGICLYYKLLESQQHGNASTSLEAVDKRINDLHAKVEAIRLQASRRRERKNSSHRKQASNESRCTETDNDTDVDDYSTAGTTIGDDEFYDCSDSESIQEDNELRNPEAMTQLELTLLEIDKSASEEFDSETYYKLQTLLESQAENVEIVWRFARICYKYCLVTNDSEKKKTMIREGVLACERVLDFQHAELYKWYATLVGLNTDFLPISEKIKNGYRFKDYVMMALELRPDDPDLHHMLGRFQYEVAGLSWLGRKVAATLSAEPPTATYEDALHSFHRAEELAAEPNSENRLFLSKTFVALNNYDKATSWLEKVLEMPAETTKLESVQSEANKLLNQIASRTRK